MEPIADLDRLLGPRDVVVVEGPDALTYLHSQVSQDLQGMVDGEQRWTFVLEPTGKIETLARVTKRSDERFELDTDAGYGQALLTRLERFKIRIAATTQLDAGSGTGADGVPAADVSVERDRIVVGWPRMGAEIVPGDTIPGGTGLTAIAVSFTKGCYPGQELVERMDSRSAEAPKSLRRVTVEPGTSAGDPVFDEGVEVGVVTSVFDTTAIAWIKRSSDVGVVIQF